MQGFRFWRQSMANSLRTTLWANYKLYHTTRMEVQPHLLVFTDDRPHTAGTTDNSLNGEDQRYEKKIKSLEMSSEFRRPWLKCLVCGDCGPAPANRSLSSSQLTPSASLLCSEQ